MPSRPADYDGWRHPGATIPRNLPPPAILVTLVCGPPAAGKTTWVNERKKLGDIVIDLDDCKVQVGGRLWDIDPVIVAKALAHRNDLLRDLANQRTGHAYVIASAPTKVERGLWRIALRTLDVVVLATPADVCVARLQADPARAHVIDRLISVVHRWHFRYAREQ